MSRQLIMNHLCGSGWYHDVTDESFVKAVMSRTVKNTLRNDAIGIRKTKEMLGRKTYDDLLPELDDRTGLPLFKPFKNLKDQLTKLHDQLYRQKVPFNTRNQMYNAQVRFYQKNEIEMRDFFLGIRRDYFRPESKTEVDPKGWTKKHLELMLPHADIKERPMMFLMYTTALRIGALGLLRLGHLKKLWLPDGRYIYRVGPLKFKTDMPVFPFTTPECTQYIDAYLEHRRICDEELDFGEATNATENEYDSHNGRPLFNPDTGASLFRKENKLSYKPLSVRKKGFSPIPESSIRGIIKSVIRTTGLVGTGIPTNHGFKKGALKQMAITKGKDLEKQKVITGHSIGVRRSYVDYSEQDLLKEYMLYLENLTVSEEERFKVQMYTERAQHKEEIIGISKRLGVIEKSLNIQTDENEK